MHSYALGWGVALMVPILRGPGDALLEVLFGEDWEDKNRVQWRERFLSFCSKCRGTEPIAPARRAQPTSKPQSALAKLDGAAAKAKAPKQKAPKMGEEDAQRRLAKAELEQSSRTNLNSVEGGGRITMEDLCLRASVQNWERTRKRAGLGPVTALVLGLMRLLLWHLLQPVVYLVAVFIYWKRLYAHWLWAALVLAAREAWYGLMALACAWAQPSYLLVDVPSSWRRRRRRVDGEWALAAQGAHRERPAVLTYVFSPEKLVIGWLTRALHAMGGGWRRYLSPMICAVSFVALLAGELVGCATVAAAAADAGLLGPDLSRQVSMYEFWNLPLPVRIGFGLTAAATISSLAGLGSVAVDRYLQSTTLIAIVTVGLVLLGHVSVVRHAAKDLGDGVHDVWSEIEEEMMNGRGRGR